MLTSLGVDYAQGYGVTQPQRVVKSSRRLKANAAHPREEKYQEGSRVCHRALGHWAYCHNRRWVDTGQRCNEGPSLSVAARACSLRHDCAIDRQYGPYHRQGLPADTKEGK